MNLEDVETVLNRRPFLLDRLHDYDVVDGHIIGLGIFEDFLQHLREALDRNWDIVERRRNPENNFIRVDIVRRF